VDGNEFIDMAGGAGVVYLGYPIAAIVGKKEVMRAVETSFVSSSCWSEPASMAAAIAIQKIIRRMDVIGHIWAMGKALQEGVLKLRKDTEVPFVLKGLAPVFHVGLQMEDPAPYQTLIIQEMARRGIHFPGMTYIMAAHTPQRNRRRSRRLAGSGPHRANGFAARQHGRLAGSSRRTPAFPPEAGVAAVPGSATV
jgi:glutamate-1-semialdehyde aminotransferase